jgi:5-(carboxyamino)imidazole ribonucleotide synthase
VKNTFKKIGILGGGQLGKMLCIAAAPWHLDIAILENDADCAAAPYATRHIMGDFRNFDDVLQFGRTVEILTIEIEAVNVAALRQLEAEGIIVHPRPDVLAIIQDKSLQKQFYQKHYLPTADFQCFTDKKSLQSAFYSDQIRLPFVWKSAQGGYDGKGVQVLKTAVQIGHLPDVACVIEQKIVIAKELAVMVARRPSGEIAVYDVVEMQFDDRANLLDIQVCPADISPDLAAAAKALAIQTIEAFDVCGLLAIEMFLTTSGELLINEVAPRPHNSAHHTIEAAETSQFEQLLRAVQDLPLGSIRTRLPSVMFNVLGTIGYTGEAHLVGLEHIMACEGAHLHLYGKKITKPYRKMGHLTLTAPLAHLALERALILKKEVRVMSYEL